MTDHNIADFAARHALELAPPAEVVVTRDQVRPGDHVTWLMVWTVHGVSFESRREGIARHRNTHGDWFTKEGMMLTQGEGEAVTITVRREDQPERPTRRPRVWRSSNRHSWAVTLGRDVYFYDSWPEAIEAACRAV